jgi:hypothetical protein
MRTPGVRAFPTGGLRTARHGSGVEGDLTTIRAVSYRIGNNALIY